MKSGNNETIIIHNHTVFKFRVGRIAIDPTAMIGHPQRFVVSARGLFSNFCAEARQRDSFWFDLPQFLWPYERK